MVEVGLKMMRKNAIKNGDCFIRAKILCLFHKMSNPIGNVLHCLTLYSIVCAMDTIQLNWTQPDLVCERKALMRMKQTHIQARAQIKQIQSFALLLKKCSNFIHCAALPSSLWITI